MFLVSLTLEATEILLFIGFLLVGAGHAGGDTWVKVGGYVGIATAACAWYASAAGVVNSMAGRAVVPVGAPMWGEVGGPSRPGPLPRVESAPEARRAG